jgi:hypothetical protein
MPHKHKSPVPPQGGKRRVPAVIVTAAVLLVTAAAFASFGSASLLVAQTADANTPALQEAYTNSFLMSDAPAQKPAPEADKKSGQEEVTTTLQNWTYTDGPSSTRRPTRGN